jgi:hypothetical protein
MYFLQQRSALWLCVCRAALPRDPRAALPRCIVRAWRAVCVFLQHCLTCDTQRSALLSAPVTRHQQHSRTAAA